MIFIFLAAILFGLVHPLSKILLNSGVPLIGFCLLYVGFRLLFQLPIVLKNGSLKIAHPKAFLLLIGIGLTGAALQLSEFAGIAKGLPVPIVTMLVYSHPVWSIFLTRFINKEELKLQNLMRVAVGLIGIALVLAANLNFSCRIIAAYLLPVFAGFCISLWVSLSKKARTVGISTWSISFYYDLFAFLALLALAFCTHLRRSDEIVSSFNWIINVRHFCEMIFYSLVVGLIPNLLFYYGSNFVSAMTTGLILLFEPLIASSLSLVLWHYRLPATFWIGAGIILMNALEINYLGIIRRQRNPQP